MFVKNYWTYIFIAATSTVSLCLSLLLSIRMAISIPQGLILLVFTVLLALACKSDFESRTIDFKLSYTLLLAALLYQVASLDMDEIIKAIASAVLTLTLLLICSIILKKIKGEDCLGRGDLRTMPAVAAVLNFKACFVSLFFACLLGILAIFIYQAISKTKVETFPFCPIILLWFCIGLLFLNVA